MMFDAFAFGVSTFCVWISIGILMKKHRFWHRFCCFYLRRVDFSYQELRQLHVWIWESQIEVPKILKIEQNDQNERKFLFYFSSLRGRGKSSAMISEVKLTHFLILFFSGTSKWGSDMRRAKISRKIIYQYSPVRWTWLQSILASATWIGPLHVRAQSASKRESRRP